MPTDDPTPDQGIDPDHLNRSWMRQLQEIPHKRRASRGFSRADAPYRIYIVFPAAKLDQMEQFRRQTKVRGRTYADQIILYQTLVDRCRALADTNDEIALLLAELELEALVI